MESPRDTIYIQDRHKLRRVRHRRCIPHGVRFADPSLSLFIEMKEMPFDSLHHKWNPPVYDSVSHASDWDGLIDGEQAYGTEDYELGRKDPDKQLPHEIKSITIRWNGINLHVPKHAYKNLFHPWLCNPLAQPAEAYVTRDRKLLYIYVAGSDAAGSYAVKFVFDRKQYITRIVNGVEDFASFDFLDATGDAFP